MLSLESGDDALTYLRAIPASVAEELHLMETRPGAAVGVFNARKTRTPSVFEFGDLTTIYSAP